MLCITTLLFLSGLCAPFAVASSSARLSAHNPLDPATSGAQQQIKPFVWRVGTGVLYFSESEHMWCNGEVKSLYTGTKTGAPEATIHFRCPGKPNKQREAVLVSKLRPRASVVAGPAAVVADPMAVNYPQSVVIPGLQEEVRKLRAEILGLQTENARLQAENESLRASHLPQAVQSGEKSPTLTPRNEEVLPAPERVLPEAEPEWGLAYPNSRDWNIPKAEIESAYEDHPLAQTGGLKLCFPFYKLEQLIHIFPGEWDALATAMRKVEEAEEAEKNVQNSDMRQNLRAMRHNLFGYDINAIRAAQKKDLEGDVAKRCWMLNRMQKEWRPRRLDHWDASVLSTHNFSDADKRNPVNLELKLMNLQYYEDRSKYDRRRARNSVNFEPQDMNNWQTAGM